RPQRDGQLDLAVANLEVDRVEARSLDRDPDIARADGRRLALCDRDHLGAPVALGDDRSHGRRRWHASRSRCRAGCDEREMPPRAATGYDGRWDGRWARLGARGAVLPDL